MGLPGFTRLPATAVRLPAAGVALACVALLAAPALAAPVLSGKASRRAAGAASLAFTQKQPWGDSYRVGGCERAAARRIFCRSTVRGRDPYQLNDLHICKLTIKARLVDRPAPRRDTVKARIVGRRCSITHT